MQRSPQTELPAPAASSHARPGAGGAPRKHGSLRALVNGLEGGFLALLLITAGIGGLWAAFWHNASSQAVRINSVLSSAQTLRADVYRGVKEVTRAQLQRDPDALDKYWRLLYGIDLSFNALTQQAEGEEETSAIASMRSAYARMQTAMNRVFAQTDAGPAPSTWAETLDPAYERWITVAFEDAFQRLISAIGARQTALEARLDRFNRLAPLLISLPIAAGLILLLVTRRRFRRQFILPMESIRQAAVHMRSGELETRIDAVGVQELRDLSLTLNDMAQELHRSRDALVAKERQAALGALVPVVAHNIRNPLASIRAAVQVVEVGDEDEWPQVRQDIIGTVDRLGRWVSALLSYLNPLQPHPVALPASELVSGAVSACSSRAGEKAVSVELPASAAADLPLEVDVDLMEQALHGLISNAIEASPRGSKVRTEVNLDETDTPNTVRILIHDQGPGIPPQIEPEELRPGPTTKRRGTGLGIPFAWKVIRAHGGTLAFTRPAAGGTCAIVSLPLTQPRPAPGSDTPQSAPTAGNNVDRLDNAATAGEAG